jgi:TonB family protein
MPTSVVPKVVIEPNEPSGPNQPPIGPDPEKPSGGARPPVVGGSRWIDYDTHELLEMISELEDERRWARLREGMLWAVLVHILLVSAVTWIPRYVFKVPPVIDPFKAIQERKDLQYLDLPPDLVKKYAPKVEIKPVPRPQPRIDRKTLEALNKPTPPVPEPKQETPAPQPQQQSQVQTPIRPNPQTQSQLEAPQPKAVPARPNFSMGSQNPADQLRDAMRGAAQSPGYSGGQPGPGAMRIHPGAGAGGVQILSDTQGVDFNGWLRRWYFETEHTWDPLIPDEVNPPILKSGAVQIRFKVLPNGRITDMQLEGRSGDTALDRAAWGALTGSNYPPLPHEFHGPYLELRAIFMYNMRQQ